MQTKENLTLRASSFGSKCELPQPFIDKVAKCGVVDSILQVRTLDVCFLRVLVQTHLGYVHALH